MNKLEAFLNKYIMPMTEFFNTNKELVAIKDGMVRVMPLTIIGSLFLLIYNLPYLAEYAPGLQANLAAFFSKGFLSTMAVISLIALVSIGSEYAKGLKIDTTTGSIVALVSFLTVTPITDLDVDVLFGAVYLFTGLLVTLIGMRVYNFFVKRNFTIKMPEEVPPNIGNAFTVIIPLMGTVFIFLIINWLMSFTPWPSIHDFIYSVLTQTLIGLINNRFFLIFLVMFQQILWFFGLHGTIIVNAIIDPIMQTMTIENLAVFEAGGANFPYIYTVPFKLIYITSGAGAILSAIVATFIVGKSKQARSVAKASLVPAIFQIQEPFHFGFPTFMNPITFIPYVFIMPLMGFLAYFLVEWGIAVLPIFNVPWTTPPIIDALITTNFDWRGPIVQIVMLILQTIIWIPFIRLADRQMLKEEAVEIASDSNIDDEKVITE